MHLDTKKNIVRNWNYWPLFKIFYQYLQIGSNIVLLGVNDYIWLVFGSKMHNDDTIKLLYYFLGTTSNNNKFNGQCDILEKRFAAS